MNFQEKLGLLERGLKRRVENLPEYIQKLQNEQDKVQAVVDEYLAILEEYKNNPKSRRELKQNKILIATAGSKNKLKQLIDNEKEFEKVIVTAIDEYQKNFGSTSIRFKMMIEEAQETLPDALKILDLIAYNKFDQDTIESLINLFLIPILTDWKEFEEELKKQEQQELEEAQEE